MRLRRIILVMVLLSAHGSPGEEGRGVWQGKGDAGITLSGGNGESLRGTAGLALSRGFGEWELQAGASLLYGRDNGVSSGERIEGSFQVNHGQKSSFYAGLNGEFLHDLSLIHI